MPKSKFWLVLMITVFLTLALAACGGGNEVVDNAGTDDGGEMEAVQVEVFSWWTGGGEAAGLEAMVEIFDA